MSISTAIDQSAVARVLGIETSFKDLRGGSVVFLPQRIAIVGQGSTAATYALTKQSVTNAREVGSLYGFGSPVHLAAKQLFPANGDGVGSVAVTVYPLEDAGIGVASTGDITPSGSATKQESYFVDFNGIRSAAFVVPIGASVADMTALITIAVNSILDVPVAATDGTTAVSVVSKWMGASANGIKISVIGPTDAGVSFAITQPVGGLVNPDVDTALALFGNVWESLVLNCLDVADTVTLDKFSTFGEGRWGALVRKPLAVFGGSNVLTVAAATAVSDTRKTDRVNIQLIAPGSINLPFVIAARQLARIAVLANNNPAHDYGSQAATGLTPGGDGDQWDFVARDLAVKQGSSTIEVKDGIVNISDVVTYYHPDGEETPAYRFLVDIVKLQNIIFNMDLIFNSVEWDGAPLVPDDEMISNRSAKKPKMARTAIAAKVDALAAEAIIADSKAVKASIQTGINAGNSKRLDWALTVQLGGNANIISADLNFGFLFG